MNCPAGGNEMLSGKLHSSGESIFWAADGRKGWKKFIGNSPLFWHIRICEGDGLSEQLIHIGDPAIAPEFGLGLTASYEAEVGFVWVNQDERSDRRWIPERAKDQL